ncbi:hypothetical protein SAMN06893096_106247 [Geodermatophilus pulveris]|uniref:Uncharacterized protein n=1 Tax=Geodermatophilus pulveris TaxID=1564159 RepID=A0A239GNA0_9ACTN|nr:hypothetical protein [Geodermatophilus pulveris]SNS69544.1 hypothetical protein SAMN06893096_106247 [Geodermatophilus pulveris]
MATTLQQLLDGLTQRATEPKPSATIEDVTGTLDHLGRALTGLAHDGLTPGNSMRQRTITDLAAACTTVGRLWPHTGGPLTDLAGAAADLVGRDRAIMGRSHRWAVSVELAEVADHSAGLAHRLLPQAAVDELATVRELAVVVEQLAQTDPPTAAGAAVLDRLVPMPGNPLAAAQLTVLDASGALAAAVDRARERNELSLRNFRAAVAAAEITSRSAATVTAAATGNDAGPLLVTGLAWQLVGRASTVFDDGRQTRSTDPHGVVPWALTFVGHLRAQVAFDTDIAALRDWEDLAAVASRMQQVTGQLSVLAEHLVSAVDRWSRTGQLYANARDLPPMDNMPEDRVAAVIAGRHVQARGADLDRLRQVVGRAAELSTGLADALHRAASMGSLARGHQATRHAPRARAPVAAERLLSHPQSLDRDATTIQSSHRTGREAPPSR